MTPNKIEVAVWDWATANTSENAYPHENEHLLKEWHSLINIRLEEENTEDTFDIMSNIYAAVVDSHLFTRENIIAALEVHNTRGTGYYLHSSLSTYELRGWLDSLAAKSNFSYAELITTAISGNPIF